MGRMKTITVEDPNTGMIHKIGERDMGDRGAPCIVKSETYGLRAAEGYLLDHRLNGPAVLERHEPSGIVTFEGWMQWDRYHRVDGPALVQRDIKTGRARLERWYFNGYLHRFGAPAVLEYSVDGVLTYEGWWYGGKRYRSLGEPACISRDASGNVIRQEWWANGEYVRAVNFERDADGTVTQNEFLAVPPREFFPDPPSQMPGRLGFLAKLREGLGLSFSRR